MQTVFPDKNNIPDFAKLDSEIIADSTLINGKIIKLDSYSEDVYSPIYIKNGDELTKYKIGKNYLMNDKYSLAALECTLDSFKSIAWKNKSLAYRISAINIFVNELEKNRDIIIKLLMWENCKSISESTNEFDRTVEYINTTANAIKNIDNVKELKRSNGFSGIVHRTPVGTVITMGPSNYPLYETYSLAIPALLMGNSVIIKIPRYGALLHSFILEPLAAAFPAGVVNVVRGKNEETIKPIMLTGIPDMLAYMGSSMFSEPLLYAHPRPYKLKLLLGLEAKNPAIILSKINMEETVREVLLGALAFNGQRCAAIKIVFVHKDIYKEFTDLLVSIIEKTIIGMPWDEGVRITPVFDPNRVMYLKSLFKDAISKGAECLNSNGGRTDHSIFYPTILGNITPNMQIYNEEQFGPIIPLVQYSDIETVYEYVNNSEFGQQISVFGTDKEELSQVANNLKYFAGRININCKCQRGPDIFPFTGKKNSGIGALSIIDTLNEFSAPTVVAGKSNSLNEWSVFNS